MSKKDIAQRVRAARARPCERCGCEDVNLYRTISGSGVTMYLWVCKECQRSARIKDMWIGHDIISEWVRLGVYESPESIPIFSNYSGAHLCAVCRQPGAEYHHWAPQSLAEFFGPEWHHWPGDYLCKEHHDQWHEIVTPYMPGRRSTQNSEDVAKWLKKNGVPS